MNGQAWYGKGMDIENVLDRGYYFKKGENDPNLRGWTLVGLASVAQACNRIDKAKVLCTDAIPFLPANSLPRRRIGQYLLLGGEIEEALPTLEAIVKDFPADPDAWAIWGAVLSEIGQHEKVARAFEMVVALRPANAEDWKALGEIQHAVGNDARAIAAFRQSALLGP